MTHIYLLAPTCVIVAPRYPRLGAPPHRHPGDRHGACQGPLTPCSWVPMGTASPEVSVVAGLFRASDPVST